MAKIIETTTLNRVPDHETKSWMNIALIQAGVMICVPTLLLGGLLIENMTLGDAIISATAGFVLATIMMTLLAIQGQKLRVPTVICSESAFGQSGSRIILSTLFIASLIGWFALQTNVCGSAFSVLMETSFGMSIPVWLSSVIWGVIMLITAVYGIGALGKLNVISVPALVLLSFYGTYVAIKNNGLEAITNHVPTGNMSILSGAMMTVGFLIVGAVIAADYTRYQKTQVDAVKSTVLGIMPAGICMTIMGAVMTLVAGNYDITIVMSELGIPVVGAVVLILASWTTNTTNAYSAGLDIVALFNLSDDKRAFVTMIAGLIGTLIGAFGIINFFQSFLDLSNYLFIPIAGVMIADFFIKMKGNEANWSRCPGWNMAGVIAWFIGVVVSLAIPGDYALFIAFFLSAVVYLGLDQILNKNKVGNSVLAK